MCYRATLILRYGVEFLSANRLVSNLTVTSRIRCKRYSTLTELSLVGPINSKSSRFVSGVHVIRYLFSITARSSNLHISLSRAHVSTNNTHSTSVVSSPIEGRSGFLTHEMLEVTKQHLLSALDVFLL